MRFRLSSLNSILLTALLCVLITASSVSISGVVQAQSQNEPGGFLDADGVKVNQKECRGRQFWPSSGRFETYTDGSEYTATLYFTLTQAEKDALLCLGRWLEIDFTIRGFTLPNGIVNGWDGYAVRTNIPRAEKDTAFLDTSVERFVLAKEYSLEAIMSALNSEEVAAPGLTNIWVENLEVGYEYFASVNFIGLAKNGDGNPRISFEWISSYWAGEGVKDASLLEKQFCAFHSLILPNPQMCIFGKVRTFLSRGYTQGAYGSGEELVFDGIRFWEFPGATANQPAEQEIEPQPTGAEAACMDEGAPYITSGLSYWPENPDSATEVEFSVTITNNGCSIFQPAVLAIAGRDPSGSVTDPFQDGNLSLAPGEAKTITVTVVLSVPGTHEFWMGFMQADRDWHEIPDTSGVSRHILVDVAEAGVGQVDSPASDSQYPSSGATIISNYSGEIVNGFSADCHYSWSFSRSAWIEHGCGFKPGDLAGPQLSDSPADGCAYYFNGETFRLSPAYVCGQD